MTPTNCNNQNVSGHCQMSLGKQNHPHLAIFYLDLQIPFLAWDWRCLFEIHTRLKLTIQSSKSQGLLSYFWHTMLYSFKMYKEMIWLMCLLWDDGHSRKLTIWKCTTQWHLPHSQSCATVISLWSKHFHHNQRKRSNHWATSVHLSPTQTQAFEDY